MRQRDDEQDGDLESPVTSRPVLHISLSFNHTRPGEGSDVESPFERCLLMSSGGVAISMAHAHGPLSRTNTAPVFSTDNNSRNGSHSAAFHQTMSHVSRSSQLSGSTAYTNSSSTSLSSMTSSATLVPASNSGPVQATNNIINQRADASRSLYQICVNLRQRLALVPDFEAHFHESDEDGGDSSDNDPVESLWKCLKRGTPLTTIYNAIQPAEPLRVDDKMPPGPKKAKLAAFKFVEACMKDLGLAPGDCFALTDLFGTDTTGFVKVTQIINIVLDIAEERGLLLTAQPTDAPAAAMPGSKMTYRDHVVRELVDTERKYVQDLENLHELKRKIEQKSVIPGDIVHDIFLNINAILDFQRRFLIRIETTNSQPDEDQKWGLPFTFFEEAFDIYQPFIANQRRAAALAKKEFDKISQADHPVVIDFNTLDGFLLKPMQRLVKYPMLLKDLRDKTGASDEAKADLTAGIEAASRVLADANAAVDKELRAEALADLIARVDDWKNHVVDNFGELLLYGHFPVVTGKSDVQKEVGPRSFSSEVFKSTKAKATRSSTRKAPHTTPLHLQLKDALNESVAKHTSTEICQCLDECHLDAVSDMDQFLRRKIFMEWQGWHYTEDKPLNIMSQANEMGVIRPQFEQYTIYLFERILLCCKELNPNKSKDKLMGVQKDKKDKKDKKTKGPDKNAKLQLKGRIFMTNVSEVLSLGKPGSWTVQIFWKGEPTPAVENFIIRFSNEESMKKWYAGVDGQRKAHAAPSQSAGSQDAAPSNFAWMRDQAAQMPNPYVQQDDDDDDDDYQERKGSVYSQHSNGFPRNASTSSLRSRSTTGESSQSLAGMVRAAPSRFPMGMGVPPLSLQTQISNPMASPSQRGGESYFSPAAESPTSSRTSANSSMFPFPRQGTPQGGWEDSNRYTAPAVARAPSRDSSLPANAHQNNRGPQRPSLPAIISQNVPGTGPPRSRSYSTPDINIQPNRRPGPPSGPVPAVPGIPAHLHGAYDAGIPRSANNSPNNGVPLRTSTQSPGSQRERPGQYTRVNTSQTQSDVRSRSPPPQSAISTDSDVTLPTQLKVKVNCDGNYVTLVVAFNITYQSLIDRIDAKVGRFSNNAIARGTMRLRYRDEDGDFVTIESDDDIQIAFQEWRESQKLQYHTGQLGEIELFCLSIENS